MKYLMGVIVNTQLDDEEIESECRARVEELLTRVILFGSQVMRDYLNSHRIEIGKCGTIALQEDDSGTTRPH